MSRSQKNALTTQDWAQAALDAIGERGIEGVAVEPLARDLGVTKGSFYWHFNNRNALLTAALALWESRETDEVLARVGQETDPRARIKRLITEANASWRASRIYTALSSATEPQFVRDYVERVSRRRLQFLIDCYAALGLSPDRSRQWALQAYSVFLGSLQIRRDLPEEWPPADDPAFIDYVKFLMVNLLPMEKDARASQAAQGPLEKANWSPLAPDYRDTEANS